MRVSAVFVAAVLAIAPPLNAVGKTSVPEDGNGPRCKSRSIVVLVIGEQTREVAEFGHRVASVVSRYPCYSIRDVTSSLEAGMAEGLYRLDEAVKEAKDGMTEFLDMRLEAAALHFSRAVDAYSDGFAYLTYTGPMVDTLMYLGAIEAGLKHYDKAVSAFRSALRLRPEADPGDYSTLPGVLDIFNEANVLARSGATGALLVDSIPSGAETYMDGDFVGITPMDLPEVEAGPHWIVIQKDGFIRKTIKIAVPVRGTAAIISDRGRLTPARRKLLYDSASRKLTESEEMEAIGAMEDVKALFLTDMAMIVRVERIPRMLTVRLSLWDLSTMQRLWTGTEQGPSASDCLGRGSAESLVSMAIATHEELAAVEEGGAATMMAKKGVWWKQWWFWTTVGVVVVGGAVAAALLTRSDGSDNGIPKDGTGAVIVRF